MHHQNHTSSSHFIQQIWCNTQSIKLLNTLFRSRPSINQSIQNLGVIIKFRTSEGNSFKELVRGVPYTVPLSFFLSFQYPISCLFYHGCTAVGLPVTSTTPVCSFMSTRYNCLAFLVKHVNYWIQYLQ